MIFSEAFRSLGYELISVRQDWSAANDDGVCLSLWRKELGFEGGRPWFDTQMHGGPISVWGSLAGNRRRIKHLKRAMERNDGYVDVVIVDGTPGRGYEDAHPWFVQQRKARWRVRNFDEDTGHFSIGVEPQA